MDNEHLGGECLVHVGDGAGELHRAARKVDLYHGEVVVIGKLLHRQQVGGVRAVAAREFFAGQGDGSGGGEFRRAPAQDQGDGDWLVGVGRADYLRVGGKVSLTGGV